MKKGTMRIAFILPGLHLVNRGAEAAFEAIARALAAMPGTEVTLIGAGEARAHEPYQFLQAGLIPREKFRRWPSIPPFRTEYRYEELTFIKGLWKVYDPSAYDAVLTCSYPFVQWALRMKKKNGRRPKQIFVTENGDWAARRINTEYKLFNCDGLVCTNPEYFRRHESTYASALIPNGIIVDAFSPGPDVRSELELPKASPLILMVSALIPSKHPAAGIRAAAKVPGAALVIAGDGPLHVECDRLGKELLGERYKRITLPSKKMPALYRSADVLLHMSREEAFGNIYIEAAACGLPVVAHDYETPRWILGDMGRFVDSSNIDATANALREAIDLKDTMNSEEQHKLLAKRFAWPVVASQYHSFISKLVSSTEADHE
jgi:glycosyltransferase involved in cell wall biosynthesis